MKQKSLVCVHSTNLILDQLDRYLFAQELDYKKEREEGGNKKNTDFFCTVSNFEISVFITLSMGSWYYHIIILNYKIFNILIRIIIVFLCNYDIRKIL